MIIPQETLKAETLNRVIEEFVLEKGLIMVNVNFHSSKK